jgi:hypothetical protein
MTLTATGEARMELRSDPNGAWGYRGQFTGGEANQTGSYRAVCDALEPSGALHRRRPTYAGQVRAATDTANRLTCTVLLLFGSDDPLVGGSLVIQGIIYRPPGTELFAVSSARVLAVTGGTGLNYEAKQGAAELTGAHRLVVVYYR